LTKEQSPNKRNASPRGNESKGMRKKRKGATSPEKRGGSGKKKCIIAKVTFRLSYQPRRSRKASVVKTPIREKIWKDTQLLSQEALKEKEKLSKRAWSRTIIVSRGGGGAKEGDLTREGTELS